MDPTAWLPHRPPFLLVDDVEVSGDGRTATGVWTPGPERYEGHFPEHPMLPGVLQLESIAQVGACALLAGGTQGLPVFSGLEKVRWRRRVDPGETLHIEVTLDSFRHGLGKATGHASVGDERCCEARLMFSVVLV